MTDKNKLIEIARVFSTTNAHILRTLLEAEGIEVALIDEHFSSLGMADSIGGVKLYILKSDTNRAEPIIQSYYDNETTAQ